MYWLFFNHLKMFPMEISFKKIIEIPPLRFGRNGKKALAPKTHPLHSLQQPKTPYGHIYTIIRFLLLVPVVAMQLYA